MGAAVRWSALLALALVVVFVFDERSRDDGDVAVLEPSPPASDVVGAPLTAAADGAEAHVAPGAESPARDVPVAWPCTPVGDARLAVGGRDGQEPWGLVVERGAEAVTLPAGTPEEGEFVAAAGAWEGRLADGLLALEARNRVRGLIVDARTGRPVERAELTVATRMGADTRLLDVDVTLDAPGGRFDLGGWPVSPSATHARLEVAAEGHPRWTSDWVPTAGVRFALDVGLVDLGAEARWHGRVVSVDEPSGVAGALVHVVPDDGAADVTLARVDGAWQLPSAWFDAARAQTDEAGAFSIDVGGRAGLARLLVLTDVAPPWLSTPIDLAAEPTRSWLVELAQAGGLDVIVEASDDATFVVGLTHAGGGLVVERTERVTSESPLRLRGLSPGVHDLSLSRVLSPTLREGLVDESLVLAAGVTSERRWRDAAAEGRRVYGEVFGGVVEGVVALVDGESFERLAATSTVDADGRFSFRTSAEAAAFAMLYGRDVEGAMVVGFEPVDLRVGGPVPTVTFDPRSTRLVVTADAGATSVALVPSTGHPDVDRVARQAMARMPLRDGALVVAGLPPGRYEVRTPGDDAVSVFVEVRRGVPAECSMP